MLENRLMQEMDNEIITCSGISVYVQSSTVTVDGVSCSLTHTEFKILSYLMKHKGIIITREQLITRIWGYDDEGDERTVNSHIRNLRPKLGDKSDCIITVVRSGYKFEEII